MLHIELDKIKTSVEKIGFEETEIGYIKTSQIKLFDKQKCFKRVTLLSEYIENLTLKGLDYPNVTPITEPKIQPDFLAWEFGKNQKNQNRYKLSRSKGLGGGQFFFKGHEEEIDPTNHFTTILKSKMVSPWEFFKNSQATEKQNPYVSRDKGWGSISCMGSPDSKLTPTQINMETQLPKLSNFDIFETMKSVQSEKSLQIYFRRHRRLIADFFLYKKG